VTDAVYMRAAATALRMITKYGRTMTLRHMSAGSYSGGDVALTPSDETVQGIDVASLRALKPGELVEGATGKFMLAASGISAPEIGDQILVGDDVYAVKAVHALDQGGLAVIYEVQIAA